MLLSLVKVSCLEWTVKSKDGSKWYTNMQWPKRVWTSQSILPHHIPHYCLGLINPFPPLRPLPPSAIVVPLHHFPCHCHSSSSAPLPVVLSTLALLSNCHPCVPLHTDDTQPPNLYAAALPSNPGSGKSWGCAEVWLWLLRFTCWPSIPFRIVNPNTINWDLSLPLFWLPFCAIPNHVYSIYLIPYLSHV